MLRMEKQIGFWASAFAGVFFRGNGFGKKFQKQGKTTDTIYDNIGYF